MKRSVKYIITLEKVLTEERARHLKKIGQAEAGDTSAITQAARTVVQRFERAIDVAQRGDVTTAIRLLKQNAVAS